MKPRTLLVLLALVAILGAFIFFFEKDLPSTDERREREKKVVGLEADEVDRITLAWGGRRVVLVRQAGDKDDQDGENGNGGDDLLADFRSTDAAPAGWRMTEPFDAIADATAVDDLLRALTGLEHRRVVADADRSQLGLDAPRAQVTLSAGGLETTVELGAEVPASSDVIVGVAGSAVRGEDGGATAFQVASTAFDDVTREPGDWRAKEIFTAGRESIERVKLHAEGEGEVLLGRRGDTFWIESPLTDRADGPLVDGLLAGLTGLRVERFLDESALAPEAMGLEPARGIVEAVLAGEPDAFILEIGDPAGDDPAEGGTRYGRVGRQLFEFRGDLLAATERDAAAWRSRGLSEIQVFQVEEARIALPDATGDDVTVELRRDEADWRRDGVKVPYTVASDVLYAVGEIRADEVLDPDDAAERGLGVGAPSFEIELVGAESTEKLRLWTDAARVDGRQAVLALPSAAIDELAAKVAKLREAEEVPDSPESENTSDEELPEEGTES